METHDTKTPGKVCTICHNQRLVVVVFLYLVFLGHFRGNWGWLTNSKMQTQGLVKTPCHQDAGYFRLLKEKLNVWNLRIIQPTHMYILCSLLSVYLSSLAGGRVSFNVGNDSPTLTGAKVTFTIDLEFPHNQKVQPNGEVVWAEDCIVNGNTPCTHYTLYFYSFHFSYTSVTEVTVSFSSSLHPEIYQHWTDHYYIWYRYSWFSEYKSYLFWWSPFFYHHHQVNSVGFEWNVSTTIEWIVMWFSMHIQGTQRMKSKVIPWLFL